MAIQVAQHQSLPLPPAVVSQVTPEEPPAKHTLYVGDLDPEVEEVDLYEVFREFGVDVTVHLCINRDSGKSLCYAYVNYKSISEANKALAILNHKKLKGKNMRIMQCQRNPIGRKNGVANLFVKNLNPSISSAQLHGLFCQYGSILSCKVAEENGKSKGFGFVQFDSEESATAAVTALHDTMYEGKKLYVSKFIKKSDRTSASREEKFTNLYVKNLPEDLTEELLKEKFSELGKVKSAVIMKNDAGKSKGFGFVDYEVIEDAKHAVEVLNGTMLGSKTIFVGRAQKKAERQTILKQEHLDNLTVKSTASNLYVKNLDTSVDDIKLEKHFSIHGHVISAKVMCEKDGTSKGFGFVSFSTPDEGKKALDSLNGTMFEGRRLYVGIAQRKEDRRKELEKYFTQCTNMIQKPELQHFPLQNWTHGSSYAQVGRLQNPLPRICYPYYSANLSMKQMQQGFPADWINSHNMQFYNTGINWSQGVLYKNSGANKKPAVMRAAATANKKRVNSHVRIQAVNYSSKVEEGKAGKAI